MTAGGCLYQHGASPKSTRILCYNVADDRSPTGAMGTSARPHGSTVCFHIIRNLETMHD